MSKITPKNLSYDSTLPPFLARLQAANQGNDRHQFSVARPKKQRTAEDEAEDEPVYFNEESGETLTKSEWESKEEEESKFGEADGVAEAVGNGAGTGEKTEEGERNEREREKVAAIGGARKRKAGKVVGGDGDEEEEEAESTLAKKLEEVKGDKMMKTATSKEEYKKGDNKPKPAKKAKKIKLSFDD